MARPLIVIDPQPRALNEIFEPKVWARLESLGELAVHEGSGRMPAERFESYLPEMALLIGQSDMPKARLIVRENSAPSSTSRPISCRTSTTRLALSAESTCWRRAPPSRGRSPRWRSEWRSTSAAA